MFSGEGSDSFFAMMRRYSPWSSPLILALAASCQMRLSKKNYSAGASYMLSICVEYIIREQPQRHDCCRLPWWLSKSRAFSNLDPRSATKYNATDSFTLETNCTCRLFLMIPSLLSAPKVNVTSQYISGNPSLTLVQSPDLLFIELWGEI